MGICVEVCVGQGVRVGSRYGVIHHYASATEVLVRFREGFETVAIDQLLPASNLENLVTVAHRYQENELELDLSPRGRDDELELELSDEEPEPVESETKEEFEEAEFAEEIEE